MAVRKALLRRLIWQSNDFGVMTLSTNQGDSLVVNIASSVSWLAILENQCHSKKTFEIPLSHLERLPSIA